MNDEHILKDYNIDDILVSLHLTHCEWNCNDKEILADESLAKDQLYQLILEIIGEDEEWKKEYSLSIKQDIKSRKNLRIEQRQKLSDLFNIKDK